MLRRCLRAIGTLGILVIVGAVSACSPTDPTNEERLEVALEIIDPSVIEIDEQWSRENVNRDLRLRGQIADGAGADLVATTLSDVWSDAGDFTFDLVLPSGSPLNASPNAGGNPDELTGAVSVAMTNGVLTAAGESARIGSDAGLELQLATLQNVGPAERFRQVAGIAEQHPVAAVHVRVSTTEATEAYTARLEGFVANTDQVVGAYDSVSNTMALESTTPIANDVDLGIGPGGGPISAVVRVDALTEEVEAAARQLHAELESIGTALLTISADDGSELTLP